MFLHGWIEYSRDLVARRRRRSKEDAVDAEIVRERLAKVNADRSALVTGTELEAKLKEIVG
ncbi:hypothetical protein [Candidatus Palauibacter sp.]|uniref:hypothetical protein n=1 Tax=Candidatus Palauibacter sp. TaxID=3101350 RepID=UPI003CC503F2